EGLFLGVELVANRQSKEPLPKKICDEIFQDGLRRGLLAMSYTHAIRLQPALTIDRDTALSGLSLLRRRSRPSRAGKERRRDPDGAAFPDRAVLAMVGRVLAPPPGVAH